MEDFLSDYAAVASASGSYVKLYLQQHTGEILEGTWWKHAQQWSFKQIMDSGVAAVPTPLAATMYPDDTVRLFFLDEDRVVQEFEIVNGEASIGSFCTVNASLPEGAGLSVVPNHYGEERFRLYHAGDEGYIQNYGFSSGEWHRPGGLASQIDFQSPIAGVNCYPWEWATPCIRTFYRNRSSELKMLEWNGLVDGWRIESTPFNELPEGAKFSVTCVEAQGSGKGSVSTAEKVMLFVVEDGQLLVSGRSGRTSWSPPSAVSIERDGTNIAAVSARQGDGNNDVHVFTSEEDGQFVHRILKDSDWEDSVINPAELLANPVAIAPIPIEMRLGRGHGDFRVGPAHEKKPEPKPTESVVEDLGSISFKEGLQTAGLSLGGLRDNSKGQYSHIQLPNDEDHEHIVFPKVDEATYDDSRNRLTFFYRAAIEQTSAVHKSSLIDSDLPAFFPLDIMKQRYKWSNPRKDGYPPHLDQGIFGNILDLFKFNGIFNKDFLGPIVQLFASSVPWSFSEGLTGSGAPWLFDRSKPVTMAGIQESTAKLHDKSRGIYTKDTIGDDPHWYTDEKFAQQHFSGTNPATIRAASRNWVGSFIKAAKAQGLNNFEKHAMASFKNSNLFVQDYSYFRAAMRQKGAHELSYTSTFQDRLSDLHGKFFHERYGCASVVLFDLNEDGKLHPLAIVLDYKEDDIGFSERSRVYEKNTNNAMPNSVVIFNKRMSPKDHGDEEHDWPWRYAKMCAQVSDWHRHEISTHLICTHLIEEGAIVAMMRTVEEQHVVFRLLKPHWIKTLPLNHAARLILMPAVIKPIAGFRPSDLNRFAMDAYEKFYWEDLYIPNDLKNRGFPHTVSDLKKDKYRNYSYAKNMVVMWDIIHTFVKKVLEDHYKDDNAVIQDTQIQDWVKEMQSDHGAQQKHFPNIRSRESLINAVTMCIHIASPQHTAVNYMQEYYQTFVPNKPPSFFRPLPKTPAELKKVNEEFVISSLPFVPPTLSIFHPLKNTVGIGNVWLLAAHLPHLLSEEVHAPLSMTAYADTAVRVEKLSGSKVSIKAAEDFRNDISALKTFFDETSKGMTTQVTKHGYDVMNPDKMAVSILI
ncbi:hypothetical protein TWF481_006398 [Arthrobotrys musiformis]|uniref:Manganese lipoxygenase n=1 Tax=Arthrobotrys musiformis TaxID=47236 RepID=A0AAV9WGN1_9PEZI